MIVSCKQELISERFGYTTPRIIQTRIISTLQLKYWIAKKTLIDEPIRSN